MRLVLAHAEQLKHGVKNEQHLGSIDRRIVVHVVDVEGIAKLLFQWRFGRGDIGNEKLNKEMLTNDEHATLAQKLFSLSVQNGADQQAVSTFLR